MMKRLRGRNLAHPGCLVGVTVGLSLGIIIAGVLAASFNTPYNTVLLIWFGLTVGLGIIGWFVGSALSSRFPALPEDQETEIDFSRDDATPFLSTPTPSEKKAEQ